MQYGIGERTNRAQSVGSRFGNQSALALDFNQTLKIADSSPKLGSLRKLGLGFAYLRPPPTHVFAIVSVPFLVPERHHARPIVIL
jgi:hypothetical protein